MSKRKKSDRSDRGSGRDGSGGEELALEGLEEEAPEMEPLLDEGHTADLSEPDSAESGPEAEAEGGEDGGDRAEQAELLPERGEDSGPGGGSELVDEPLPEFRLVRHTFEWADPEVEATPASEPEPEYEPEPESESESEPDADVDTGPEPDEDARAEPRSDGEFEGSVQSEPGTSDAGPVESGFDDSAAASAEDPVVARLASAREAWAEGEQQTALDHLDAALAAAPERLEVLIELGSTMGILGRYEEADRYLRRAQRLAPGDLAVAAQLAIILFRRGLYGAAELELRAITERDPGQADALFYRGEALNRLGRADEALDVLTRVVELEPTNPRAYQLLGMLYDRKAMPELATAMYRKARELGRR